MKRILLFFVLLVVVGLAGCMQTSNVTLEFQSKAFTLEVGETVQLLPTIKGAESYTVVYNSLDQTIVSVNTEGLLTAISEGTTKVVARLTGVENIRVDVDVTVIKGTGTDTPTPPSENKTLSLVVANGDNNMIQEETIQLRLLSGVNTYAGQIIWMSGNPSVATVSPTGLVTAVAAGTATITAIAGSEFKTIQINVEAKEQIIVPNIESITISGSSFVTVEQQTTLTVTDNTGNVARVIWVADTPHVATINEMGVVTGVSTGIAQFTAKAQGSQNITASYMMLVKEADSSGGGSNITSIEVTGVAEILTGNKMKLNVTYTPSTEAATFTYTSTNESVATVDAAGWVTGVGGGTVQIVVTLNEDTSKSATYTVTVIPLPEGITISGANNVSYGQNILLQAAAYPIGASSLVTWTSSNTAIATVDANGRVTGVATGSVTITATSIVSSTIKATHQVTVSDAMNITLNPTSLSIAAGASQTITATVIAASLTDKSVVWSSSNTSVATVDANGKVTGIAQGSATIIAKLNADNSIQAQASVTVSQAATPSISLSDSSISIITGTTKTLTATVSNTSNTSVTWSSSNTGVATVSNGVVTGVAAGSATITATSVADTSVKATCAVTVTAAPAGTLTVTQSPTGTIAVGASGYQIYVADSSGTAVSRLECTFTSSNSSVATVSAYGTISALANGTATITVTHSTKGTGSIVLTIGSGGGTTPPVNPPAGSLTVTQSPTGTIAVGASGYQLYISDSNGSISRTECTFTSSNSSVATVSSYGTISALAAGTATITVSHPTKGTGSITLTVGGGGTTPPPSSGADYPQHIIVDKASTYTGTFSNVQLSGSKLVLSSGATSGTYTSKQFSSAISFTKMVGSWSATYPATSATVEVQFRLKIGSTWTSYLSYRQWAKGKTNSAVDTSVSGAKISCDEIYTTGSAATGFQYTVTLRRASATSSSPQLSLVAATLYNSGRNTASIYDVTQYPTSKVYSVERLYQYSVSGIGGIICSPTTSTMLLKWKGATAFGGYTYPHQYIAGIAYDSGSKIYGNWTYNCATIGSYGYNSYVRMMYSYQELVRHLAYVGPVGVSVQGTVAGSQGSYYTNGHLMVVRGYSRSGTSVTFNINDPAKNVAYTMTSTQLMNCWSAKKVAYIVE
ncbi:MAG: Ig-like domain-containing protein [Bacilli bacterium]|jgi:uncharacterized protein YjdB